MVEALAAMLEFDRDVTAAENAEPMRAAAARVRTGEVTQAVRDSEVEAGEIAAGDWIGVTREGVIAVASSPSAAAIELLSKLIVATDELVTVLVGADAHPDDVDALRAHIGSAHPHVELEVHDGDQPLYPFILGLE
jgi:dihydroxyacetone kinase-like predicted kinase